MNDFIITSVVCRKRSFIYENWCEFRRKNGWLVCTVHIGTRCSIESEIRLSILIQRNVSFSFYRMYLSIVHLSRCHRWTMFVCARWQWDTINIEAMAWTRMQSIWLQSICDLHNISIFIQFVGDIVWFIHSHRMATFRVIDCIANTFVCDSILGDWHINWIVNLVCQSLAPVQMMNTFERIII